MRNLMFVLAIISVLSFGLVTNSHAATIFDGTKLIGSMVKDRDGVELGRIFDLVITSQGKVEFAVVSQVIPPGVGEDVWSGHVVAVPFGVLRISNGKSQELQVVLNADKEKFYEAPEVPSSFFNNGAQVSFQKEAEIDRYFGIVPYWTNPYSY